MRNFFSLLNKHKDAEARLDGQKMSSFQRTEDGILNQCFQRLANFLTLSFEICEFNLALKHTFLLCAIFCRGLLGG